MRTVNFLVPLSALVAASALAAPATYVAQNGNATFEHKVGLVMVRGEIAGVSAQAKLDSAQLTGTTGKVTVPLSDLKTGNGLRDSHAKSGAALATDKFPNATFQLQKLSGGRLKEGQTVATTAQGQLTVKGVTKTIVAPVKATLRGDTVQVATQFKFNPHDYGVNYRGTSSPSVTVNVSFDLKPTSR